MMHILRHGQHSAWLRLIAALALGAAITAGAWWAGQVLTLALLFVALVVVLFAVLSIAPDAIARWRGHHWRWSWRQRGWGGPDTWLGTGIPRRPRPPRMPPRAAAAQPERDLPAR